MFLLPFSDMTLVDGSLLMIESNEINYRLYTVNIRTCLIDRSNRLVIDELTHIRSVVLHVENDWQ